MNLTIPRRVLAAIGIGILGGAGLFVPEAQATFIATIEQVGSNVVVTGTGTIDLTGLTFLSIDNFSSGIVPIAGVLGVGSPAGQPVDTYSGFSGPANFGTGGAKVPSDSGSGDKVAILASDPSFPQGALGVPMGYLSGAPLSDTSIFNNSSLASLGITAGTYTWTWGTGMHADSFIINAGPIGSVPEAGSSLLLLLMAVGLFALASRWHPRRIPAH